MPRQKGVRDQRTARGADHLGGSEALRYLLPEESFIEIQVFECDGATDGQVKLLDFGTAAWWWG